MDEKPDQIIGHIEAQRDELGRNLNELETRVRQSTDWRTYYDRNPMLMLGAALGGGLLLGSMVGAKSSGSAGLYRPWKSRSGSSAALGLASAGVGASAASSWSESSDASHHSKDSHASSQQWRQVSETMDHIKDALIAFGTAKAKEFLSQAVPGLDQHLSEAEKKHRSRRDQQSWQQDSSAETQHFASHGRYPQEGGAPPSGTNWESDIYRSSGQYSGEVPASEKSGFGANRTTETGDRVPSHQY